MEPKFQSSFIPKGPVASSTSPVTTRVRRPKTILGIISVAIFSLSVLAAVGVFGYKLYLEYSVKNMAIELEAAKASIEEETVKEIMRLNNRILATEDLIDSHSILSPLLTYLEASTLKNVRFTEFTYSANKGPMVLSMRGEARGYAALAQQAEIFKKHKDFKNLVFSNLALDAEGNVVFTFTTEINPNYLSYGREVERINSSAPRIVPTSSTTPSTATSSRATTTPRTATTTRN